MLLEPIKENASPVTLRLETSTGAEPPLTRETSAVVVSPTVTAPKVIVPGDICSEPAADPPIGATHPVSANASKGKIASAAAMRQLTTGRLLKLLRDAR